MKTIYVVGFAFKPGQVLLIRKKRPKWQSGLLNGIGGHVEKGEMPQRAMAREFLEETGCNAGLVNWRRVGRILYPKADLHVFSQELKDYNGEPHTTTDEEIKWCSLKYLHQLPVIPNLKWLIPMALYDQDWVYSLSAEGVGPNV